MVSIDPKSLWSSSIQDFTRITNQMPFKLRLSHLLVVTENMLKTYMPTLFSERDVGMDVRMIQRKAVVTKTKPGFPIQATGIKPGQVIT
jgi:hypothetical protein